MSRLSLCALAAVLVAGSIVTATDAAARHSRSPGGQVRSFSAAPRISTAPRLTTAPRFSGVRSYRGVHRFHAYPRRLAFRGYRYAPYPYFAYNGCYRWRTVWTAYGPRLARVNVCYPYAYRYRQFF
jgi:hypothetical protein